jgi:hypothetical protein
MRIEKLVLVCPTGFRVSFLVMKSELLSISRVARMTHAVREGLHRRGSLHISSLELAI